jgi:hypothetical protein
MLFRSSAFFAALTLLVTTQSALAQDTGLDDEAPPADGYEEPPPDTSTETGGGVATPSEAASNVELSDAQHDTEAEYGTGDEGRSSTDPFEDPHEAYYFVGAFYRHMFIPQFLLNLFTERSSGSDFPAFGAEFTYRKDGFSAIGSLWLARPEGNGPFRANGDPIEDTEWVQTDMWAVFVSGTFLWSTSFTDWFAIEYGVGVGLGVIIGDVYRTEAYPTSGPDDGYVACAGPGNPDGRFCEPGAVSVPRGQLQCADGMGHYNCREGQWSEGGDVPNVVPWLAIPHLGLRFKPIKQLQLKVEGGFGLGFFMGFSAAYGF